MTATFPDIADPSAPRPFVGRGAELAALTAALGQSRQRGPRVLLLGGEAGAGKTRLLEEFARSQGDAPVQLLAGGCLDLGDGALPYGAFVEAMRSWLRTVPPAEADRLIGPARAELARLLPFLGDAAVIELDREVLPDLGRTRLFEQVRGLLERVARVAPTVLVIEDLHWSDQATRDLFAFLARNLAEQPLLLVGTFRTDELSRDHPLRPLLVGLARDSRTVRVDLPPLDRAAVVALVSELTGGEPDRVMLEDIVDRAEGNPFYAEQLAAAAQAGADLPDGVVAALDARLDQLPDVARRVVRVASAGGVAVAHDLLDAAAAMDEAELEQGLRIAVDAQLLLPVATPPGYRFRHALFQEVVHASLLPGERTRLHARMAELLERCADPAGSCGSSTELAWHYELALDLPRALQAAVTAAREADAVFAHVEAVAHLERAIDLWDRVPDAAERAGCDLPQLLRDAAIAAVKAGDPRRGEAMARRALASLDPDQAPDGGDPVRAGLLWMWVGQALRDSGRKGSLQAYRRAVALVPEGDTWQRACVLAALGSALMLKSLYREALGILEQGLATARAAGSQPQEAYALTSLGPVLAHLGESDRGMAVLIEGRAVARSCGRWDYVFKADANRSDQLDSMGRFEDAAEVAVQGADEAYVQGLSDAGAFLLGNAAESLLKAGELDRVAALLARAHAARLPGGLCGVHITLLEAELALRRGRVDAAAGLLARSQRVATSYAAGPQFRDRYHALDAEVALLRGQPERVLATALEGMAHVRDVAGTMRYGGAISWAAMRAAVALARAESQRGAEPAASEAAETVRAWYQARSEDATGQFHAWVALAEAEWSRCATSRPEGEPAAWRQAVAAFDALAMPAQAATARLGLAAALAATGSRDEASALVTEVLTCADATGAGALRDAAETLGRRAGLRLVAGAPASASRLRLTERELEVLRLITAGASNREIGMALFISTKTASVHVSHILAKLGVKGRGQAAALAVREGLVPA